MTDQQLKELLQRYAENVATPEENKQLLQCFLDPGYEDVLKEFIADNWDNPFFESLLQKDQSAELYQSIQHEINFPKSKVVKMSSRKIGMAAAAVALLIAASALFFLMSTDSTDTGGKGRAFASVDAKRNKADIAPPSSSNAVLFFDDGAKVNLNNTDSGILDKQPGVELKKLANGQIVYTKNNNNTDQQKGFNTIYNPRGSKMTLLVLSDSTKVWLNAESSLKYPVAFTGAERRVEISGEAYFEVAHNANQPFIVANGKTIIKVLGTHFNVNTYKDNGKVIVTLLEGSVNVSNGIRSGMLKPGQQARVNDEIRVINSSDTAKAMAWKKEVFDFTQTSIVEIMKQMERWYDVQVEYQGDMSEISLSGIIDRNINASKVLEMLEMSSGLDFKIGGRKIVVSKK